MSYTHSLSVSKIPAPETFQALEQDASRSIPVTEGQGIRSVDTVIKNLEKNSIQVTEKKKHDILSVSFRSALDRTARCAIHIRNSCRGLAYSLTGLDFHDVSLRGRQKLALAKQV